MDVPVGSEKRNSSYSNTDICAVEASRALRLVDESERTFELAAGVVDAVRANVVLGGSETAAGSANVPDAPLTDGTATDCAVAATGWEREALAAASRGTDAGAVAMGVGPVVAVEHAVKSIVPAMTIAATGARRRAVRGNFKQTSKKIHRCS